jgi:hypothetical protein
MMEHGNCGDVAVPRQLRQLEILELSESTSNTRRKDVRPVSFKAAAVNSVLALHYRTCGVVMKPQISHNTPDATSVLPLRFIMATTNPPHAATLRDFLAHPLRFHPMHPYVLVSFPRYLVYENDMSGPRFCASLSLSLVCLILPIARCFALFLWTYIATAHGMGRG